MTRRHPLRRWTARLCAGAAVSLLCALMLAERPAHPHARRTQAQTTPAKPGSKAKPGKAAPHAHARKRRRRPVEVDDPIEFKRAARHTPPPPMPTPHLAAQATPLPAHALLAPAATHPTPAAVRIDGFGAEGALLNQRGVPIVDPDQLVLTPTAPPAHAAKPPLPPATRAELAEEAVQPIVLPGLYRHGRLVMPVALKGSREVLVHQNEMADAEGLDRIDDAEELDRMRAARLLIDLPASASLRVNPGLPADRRCARPWTVRFAADTARAFAAKFRRPLQVNSAVRTVDYQLRLQRTNGNAAATEGDTASPHLTGQAIDFAKRGLTRAQLAWMRAYLLPLMRSGKIDVEEEFQQACFHISVYRTYLPASAKKHTTTRTDIATLHSTTVGR